MLRRLCFVAFFITLACSARVAAQELQVDLAVPSGEIGAPGVEGGDAAQYVLTVANAGMGAANDVAVEIELPSEPDVDPPAVAVLEGFEPPVGFTGCGLECGPGEVVTMEVGTLAPGESRTAAYALGFGLVAQDEIREPMTSTVVASASNAADATDTVDIYVDNTPLLRLGLAPDPGFLGRGALGYTLTYVNVGDVSPTGVTLRMPVPDGTSFVSATDGGTLADGVVTWDVGTLVQGEGGQVRLNVDVDVGLPAGELISASAGIEAGTPAAPAVAAAATTKVGIASPLRLAVTAMSAGGGSAYTSDGSEVTYVLKASNTGASVLTDLTARLTLIGSVGRGVATLSPGFVVSCMPRPIYADGTTCDWEIGSLEPGETRTRYYRAPAAAAPTIVYGTLTARVAPAATSVVLLDSDPLLRLAIVPDPGPVELGESLGYTLVFGNTGDVPTSEATIRMSLPEWSTFVSATGGGLLTDGAVTWSLDPIPPGEGGEVRVLLDMLPGGELARRHGVTQGTFLYAQATVDPNTVLESPATADVASTVHADSPLRLAYGVSSSATRPIDIEGGEQTYSLTVSNEGAEDLGDVAVQFLAPRRILRVYAVPDWSFGPGGLGNSVWDVGLLAAGERRTAQLLMPVVDASVDHGGEVLYSTAVADAPGVTSSHATTASVIDHTPALRLALAPDPGPVTRGDDLNYTVTFGNAADRNADATIRMPLPENTSFVSATGGGSLIDDTVVWELGSIPPGAGGRILLVVNVDPAADDGSLLLARASGSGGDPSSRTSATAATQVQAETALSATYDATESVVEVGEELGYTITVKNNQTADLTDIEVRLLLPALLDEVDLPEGITCPFPPPNCGGGSGCANKTNVCFWNVTVLPGGESESLSFSGKAAAPAGDIIRGYATASATASQEVALQHHVVVGDDYVVSNEPSIEHSLPLRAETYPTPFGREVVFELSLPTPDDVRLVIFDALGRRVGTVVDGRQAAGRHVVSWDTRHLPTGLYLYRLVSSDGMAAGTIVKGR